ncbi:ATP-binding cassette domain-containing protein [Streptomyces sp. cmx-18-6]|uniref:ABC transporter ATP-binding protein n=1 Tax=Streptomyces sp. cmx-18-6 TaxID=2790930 RepID=UPI0039816B1A
MTDVSAIAAEGATVVLDGTTLLSPTTFAVTPGEFRCLTGPNGSGRTTLLWAFLGSGRLTDGPSRGGEGVDLARPRHRRLVALLVERVPVARDMTLREQVTLVAASWHDNTTTTAERAEEVIDRLGLPALGERFPAQLSSGQL